MRNNSSNTAGILGIFAIATIVGILALVLLKRKKTPEEIIAKLEKDIETCLTLKQ